MDKAFVDLQDAAEILTPYSVAFRYPGSLLESERKDVEETLHMAQYVIDFTIGKLPVVIRENLK